MQNRTRVARGNYKILRRNIHYKRARVPINFQRSDDVKRAASYNTAALQNATSLQSAFIPQAVQNFILNLLAATSQILSKFTHKAI